MIKTNRNIRFFDTMSILPISSFASQVKLSGSKQIPRSWRENKTDKSSSLSPLTLLLLVKKKLVHRLWFFLLSWTNGTDQKLISSSSNAIASSKENEKTIKHAKQQETTWSTSKKHKKLWQWDINWFWHNTGRNHFLVSPSKKARPLMEPKSCSP